MMLLLLTVLLLFVNSSISSKPHHIRIQHTNVETHSDIVIDTQTPHFSWQLADEYDNDGSFN